MLRLRTSPEGEVVPGEGHLGRGAWTCPEASCLDRAVRSGSLARALRCAPEQDPDPLVGRLMGQLGMQSGVDV